MTDQREMYLTRMDYDGVTFEGRGASTDTTCSLTITPRAWLDMDRPLDITVTIAKRESA